jgi:hypothetical protein
MYLSRIIPKRSLTRLSARTASRCM